MPGFVDTGLNLVHVDDVASGHVAALMRGKVGERYILGGENVSLAHMLRAIALIVGRQPPRFKLPRAPLIQRLPRRSGLSTAGDGTHVRQRMFFSSAKAERNLGSRPPASRASRRCRLVPRGRLSAMTALLIASVCCLVLPICSRRAAASGRPRNATMRAR
jgi:nucleoside-diphosphate-sugar epimerase